MLQMVQAKGADGKRVLSTVVSVFDDGSYRLSFEGYGVERKVRISSLRSSF